MLRMIISACLCYQVTATQTEGAPKYLVAGQPIELTDFISCPYVSEAVAVIRKIFDKPLLSPRHLLDSLEPDEVNGCHIQSGTSGHPLVLRSTLASYKNTAKSGYISSTLIVDLIGVTDSTNT